MRMNGRCWVCRIYLGTRAARTHGLELESLRPQDYAEMFATYSFVVGCLFGCCYVPRSAGHSGLRTIPRPRGADLFAIELIESYPSMS